MSRQITYKEAIREALDHCLGADPRVYLMGLGVPDPKGIFGTTLGLREKYGPERVLDMPTSENGMTGVAIGSALVGRRPVLVHQRVEFAMLTMEQVANQAAKWYSMFGRQSSIPLVIRVIVGRGWGQGPQHCQSLQAWFAHIPGLKVLMPATAHDAKGLMIAAIEDDDPVIFLEHRWLHDTFGPVPEGPYRVPIGSARVVRPGRDVTLAACSYMVLEALRAAEVLAGAGVEAEVVDIRSLAPFDHATVVESVRRTGRLVVADTGWKHVGFAAEVVARVCEDAFAALKAPPRRACLLDVPVPTTRALADRCYPRAGDLVEAVRQMLAIPADRITLPPPPELLDVPDPSFRGPF